MRSRISSQLIVLWPVGLIAIGCSSAAHDGSRPKPQVDVVDVVDVARSTTAGPNPDTLEKSETLDLTFVGDIIFGRYRADGYDPIADHDASLFGDILPAMRSDLLVGNLETPIVRALPQASPIGTRFRFGASAEAAKQLISGTFSAVSLANNHWFDMRHLGVDQTPAVLRELGVVPLGPAVRHGNPFVVRTIERRGWRVGFVAVTTRTNARPRPKGPYVPYARTTEIGSTVRPILQEARGQHDVLVVLIHWGQEYADDPSRAQIRAAHQFVDAGADVVIGHHPHVLQGMERYNGRVVAYSLGNFVFENTREVPRQTGVLRLRFSTDSACATMVRFHPAYVKRKPIKHPVPARGWMNTKVKRRMRMLGDPFDTTWLDEGDDLVLEPGATCPEP